MTAGDGTPHDDTSRDHESRLDSWKEIAAHFQRDVRTVRRWEATEGLPVHRHQHRERGSVYAYKSELDAWWANGRQRQTAVAPTHRLLTPWLLAAMTAAMLLAAGALYFVVRTRGSTGAAVTRPLRVVVLPFDGPNDDGGAEPLGDEIAADVISRLGRLSPKQLAVIAYTSATSYRGTGKRASEIGRELHADYLVEGSLRRADRTVLVAVRLVAVNDETLLKVWDYRRPTETLPDLADEVAGSVANTLRVGATLRRVDKNGASPPIDPEAYQLYLRGRYHLQRRAGQLALARQYLEAAVVRAPSFAPIHASLADAYTRAARSRPDSEPDAWIRAEAAAKRALALDDSLPLAHAMIATIALFRDWDWARAEGGFRRAAALAPRDPDVCNGYAIFLRATGAMDAAIAERRSALEADPLNVALINRLGADYVFARRYGDAVREYEKALELEPDYRPAVDGLADACARSGLDQQAGAHTVRLLMLRGDKDAADQFERLFRVQGYRLAARWLDERNLERHRENPSINAWNLAYTYARLGDKDAALRWLEAAFATRDAGLLQMRVDPDLDGLRSDPRFGALLNRLGPRDTPRDDRLSTRRRPIRGLAREAGTW